MRRLLYIPIVHSEADMGRVGAVLEQESVALLGKVRWALHKDTVGKFWDNIAAFLCSFAPHSLKIYQDGLPADGDMGKRIVEQAAKRGSRNYQLVSELLDRGAELRKTDDPALLVQEHENIMGLVQGGPLEEQRRSAQTYQSQRNQLLEKRDRFIAETIGATLTEKEVGVLFIGAYHNVASYLMGDIIIEYAKNPRQVAAYFEELFQGQNNKRLQVLAQYLVSPVSAA